MTAEARRAPRRPVDEVVWVTDCMTEQVIGRVGNLSAGGLLLIAHQTMPIDALYQARFTLQDGSPTGIPMEVGMQLLWSVPRPAPDQIWSGFRFISIAPDQAHFLHHWSQSRH